LEPAGGAVDHHLFCGFDAVRSGGVLCGGEFLLADGLEDNRILGQRQSVEDEGFELYAVWLIRLDAIAGAIDVRGFLYGPVNGQREAFGV